MQALGSLYRTGNYAANLINGGIPIRRINGDDVLKPSKSIKDLARKKALRNYTKLESEHIFLEEDQEYDDEGEKRETEEKDDNGFYFW